MSDKTDNSNNKLTSIAISKENYERLKKLGYTGMSFNTVLSSILDDIYQEKRTKVSEVLEQEY